MSNRRKRKDSESNYNDKRFVLMSSMPRWMDMGHVNNGYNGYDYIDPWGQIGLRYAPQYYQNTPVGIQASSRENSSSSDGSESYVKDESSFKGRLQGRKLALLVIVVGLLACAAAITVILVLSLKPAESQPDKFRVVTMSLSVSETFTIAYRNKSSSDYKLFAGKFASAIDEIFQANNIKGYKGVQIEELKNGSVVVIFTVVIEFKQSEDPPNMEVLVSVITRQRTHENDTNNVVVKDFKIMKTSIVIVRSDELAFNPISTTAEPTTISTTATKATSTTGITFPPSQGPNNFSIAIVNLTVDDTFKPEYYNTSSVEYKTFTADFTNAMNTIFNKTEGYKGIQIKEIQNGSVIVIFMVVIEVNLKVNPVGVEEIRALIVGENRDVNDNMTVIIGVFRIRTTSVSVITTNQVVSNPLSSPADSTTPTTLTWTSKAFNTSTVKADITGSTSASNVQLNLSTITSTITVIIPPATTSTTLQLSTTTSMTTSTSTSTSARTSPETSLQNAVSSKILTSMVASMSTTTIMESPKTSLVPSPIRSTSTASTMGHTTYSQNTSEMKGNSNTVYSSTSALLSTISKATSYKTLEQSDTITQISPSHDTTSIISFASLKPIATNTIISTLSTLSTPNPSSTSLTNAKQPNITTKKTPTTITEGITTLTMTTGSEQSTTLFTPNRSINTLSNNTESTTFSTKTGTETTASNVTISNMSSNKLSEPNLTSTTTVSSTIVFDATRKSTSLIPLETNTAASTTLTATTNSPVSTYKATSPTPSKANMTIATTSITTSLTPATSSIIPANSSTAVMTATTTSTVKGVENITSTMSAEKNITTATPSKSRTIVSIMTKSTESPTPNIASTITSTSTVSLQSTTNNTIPSSSKTQIMTSTRAAILTTVENVTSIMASNTTSEPRATSTTTLTSTTSFKPTIINNSSYSFDLNVTTVPGTTSSNTLPTPTETTWTGTSALKTTTSLKSNTNSTTSLKSFEINARSEITQTSSTKAPIITYSTIVPKPSEANMTVPITSTTTVSLTSATTGIILANYSTPVNTSTTPTTLKGVANITTYSFPSTNSTLSSPSKANGTSTTTSQTTNSLKSNTTYIISPKPTENNPSLTSTAPLITTQDNVTLSNTTTQILTLTTALKSIPYVNATQIFSSNTVQELSTIFTANQNSVSSFISNTTSKPSSTSTTAELNTTIVTKSSKIETTVVTIISTVVPNPTETSTNILLPNKTELNTNITSTSSSTATQIQTATSAILPSNLERNATIITTLGSSYLTGLSSTDSSTMATTNSTTISMVSGSSSIWPGTTNYVTITTTTASTKGVAFNVKYYTAVFGVPLELVCTVIGWNGNLTITRMSLTNQQEITVANFVNNKTGAILNGFAVNITFTGYNVNVYILILNLSCQDEGSYYCRRGAVSDTATVKRERAKPILQLPDIMIRDEYHSIQYPFVCERDIENFGENLIAEVNKNGSFYFYEGYDEKRVNITTACGDKRRFTFFINGKFTSDWNNAKVRCVVLNSMTNGDTFIRLASEEKIIRLVSADVCMGLTQGSNISHPQSDCDLYLTCLNGAPVPRRCQKEQCFYDNIGMCRDSKCPFVYCIDTYANIGEPTLIRCSLLFCNDSFSLSIKHSEVTLFSSNNITGNLSQRSDDKYIQVWITNGKAELTVSFTKTNCNHSGEYIVILDKGIFTDRAILTFKVPPQKPTLLLPQTIVTYTQAIITCIGEQGVPRRDMYMEVMFSGSNFNKYDNTILTTDNKNCSNMGTLVMNFVALEKWRNAKIRCVIDDNNSSRLESDVYLINTTSSGVSISPSEITGFINDTVQINCTVTGIRSSDSIIISRLTPTLQGEEPLSNITIVNVTKNNQSGIHISSTVLSESDMIIHISINFLQCRDGGTYYCKTGNRSAITRLTISSKPDKPRLMLPLDAVSDGYNQLGDPFVCQGNVGYPGGNLLPLIKINGTYKVFQPFKISLTKGNVSDCKRVDRLEFYLDKFTSDLHNSTLKCVATNNETLANGQPDPYDEKVLLLVPGSTCYGAVNGLILPYSYPFDDCKKYVECYGNRTFVRNGGCKDGECYYTDMKRCEQERTTTTTIPTTTTEATCPNIHCLGTETLINSTVSINCKMILCGPDFDLSIALNSTILFRETIHGNHSSTFLANARLSLIVERKAGTLIVTFDNILCNQTGRYNISIYGGNASNMAELRVKVNPDKPSLIAPLNIYKNQEAKFTCIGQMGIPPALMSWQLMLTAGNFENYSVQGSPVISVSECSVIWTWTVQLYPAESWKSIRCLITPAGSNATKVYSDTIEIALKEPGIYFTPSSSSGYIGSPHRLTCQARNMTNINSIKIERHTTFSFREEVVSIALNGTTTSNFNGIRINPNSSISATTATIYVDFDNLSCKEEGDYYCNTSRGHISVMRSPKVPSIKLPSEFIDGQQHQYITCFGEIGYPAGYIIVETNLTGTFAEYNFTDVTSDLNVNSENCSATYTLKFRNKMITKEWNNTRVRCLAKGNDNATSSSASLTSEEKVILLITADFCSGKDANGMYSHPYVCSSYITCSDAGTFLRPQVLDCSAALCFDSRKKACDWCSNVNCTQIV